MEIIVLKLLCMASCFVGFYAGKVTDIITFVIILFLGLAMAIALHAVSLLI